MIEDCVAAIQQCCDPCGLEILNNAGIVLLQIRPWASLANGGTAMTLLASASGVTVIVRMAVSLFGKLLYMVSCCKRVYGDVDAARTKTLPCASF